MDWVLFFLIVTGNFLTVSSSSQQIDLYGCRYLDLCPIALSCINDNLFGHCGDASELRFRFHFKLDLHKLQELGVVIDALRLNRETWADSTTQLVMNEFLSSNRIFEEPEASQNYFYYDENTESPKNYQLFSYYFPEEVKRGVDYGSFDYFGINEDYVQTPWALYENDPDLVDYETSENDDVRESRVNQYTTIVNLLNGIVEKQALKETDLGDDDRRSPLFREENLGRLATGDDYDYLGSQLNNFAVGSRNDNNEYYLVYEYEPNDMTFSFYEWQNPYQPNQQKDEDLMLWNDEPRQTDQPTVNRIVDDPTVVLKREHKLSKNEEEEGNMEYPYPVDNQYDHELNEINDVENEYSHYVDWEFEKLRNNSKLLKPAESFTISKVPRSHGDDDYDQTTSEEQKQEKGMELADMEYPEFLKRDQITLYDDANIDDDSSDSNKLPTGGTGGSSDLLHSYSVAAVDPDYCFIQTEKPFTYQQGNDLMMNIANVTGVDLSYNFISFHGQKITFKVGPDAKRNATEVARLIMKKKNKIEKGVGIKIESTGIGKEDNERIMFTSTLAEEKSELTLICVALLGCIVGLLCGVVGILALKNNKHKKCKSDKLNAALSGELNGPQGGCYPSVDYQELCREHKAVTKRTSLENKAHRALEGSVAHYREGSVSSEQSERASVSSWNDESCGANLDITTGHIVLAYMESHLHDKGQLNSEWESLCSYEPEEVSFAKAAVFSNQDKNRFPTALPFDHNCITLNPDTSQGYGDYINASAIRDMHPERAAYILAQAPLENTVSDFWQMVWEQRCTVAVLFAGPFNAHSRLTEDGLPQFWPGEGNAVYHNFEVHLVSEHVWCEEYLVRSLYLKNLLTSQTRTVTLFHYLAWAPHQIPDTGPRPLLEFRRKVNKAYKGKCSPVIVMCASGCDQSACYVLIDLVLNKIYKGAKEIDISATLEHLRDQRFGSVTTKEQFEFCLGTVAEEVNGILKAIEPTTTTSSSASSPPANTTAATTNNDCNPPPAAAN